MYVVFYNCTWTDNIRRGNIIANFYSKVSYIVPFNISLIHLSYCHLKLIIINSVKAETNYFVGKVFYSFHSMSISIQLHYDNFQIE